MRKLASFAAAFALAVFLSHYLLPVSWCFYGGAVCAALCFGALILRGNARVRAFILALGAAAGFFSYGLFCRATVLPAESFSGQEAAAEAKVVEYPQIYDGYGVVTVRLSGEGVLHVRTRLSSSDCDALSALTPGDFISFDAKFKSASVRYGKPWDGYNAEGVYLTAYADSGITVTGRSKTAFAYFPQTLAKRVVAVITELVPGRAGAFLTALVSGDKRALYEDEELYADLADAGILHTVAISGMHVAFLVGFLYLVLRKKKYVAIFGIPAIWIFALMAGASPSVLRAAFMQTLVLISPLLHRDYDSLTALAAALLALLILNPDACASVSLQLSFASMLGMVLFAGRWNGRMTAGLRTKLKGATGLHKYYYKAGFAVVSAFCASLSALVFTVPLMALHFGYVSTYSILVNIIIFWAVSAAFITCGLAALFGLLWLPLGVPLAFVAGLLAKFIIAVCGFFSALPFSVLCTENDLLAWWIAAVYLIFGAWWFFTRKKPFRPAVPASVSVSLLCAVIVFTQLRTASSPGRFTAVDVGQGQSLVFTDGGNTDVIDCGGINTAENAGETVAKLLRSEGRDRIDVLALTHFDSDHVNGVIRLMSRVKVENLVIPDLDGDSRTEIEAFARKHGTTVYIISEDERFTAGDITLTAFAPVSLSAPQLMYLTSDGDCDILVTGDAYAEEELGFLLRHSLPDTEIYVAGHHGSKNASSQALLEAIRAETAVVSCGYNTYGHPAPEALSRFDSAGMTILRTDELGNVTLPMGD